MRGLYARIALGVIVAFVMGWLSVGLFVLPFRRGMEQQLRNQMLGSGLQWVARQLDRTPEAEWDQRLAEARRDITIPLEIVAADALPDPAATVSGVAPAIGAARAGGPGSPALYIPLRGGSHFLVAGPLPLPPFQPRVLGDFIFVFVSTVTASAAVGIPLVRRLRRLRGVIGELGGGNWALRLDANAEGALSELAESINRTAAQVQEQFREREALLQAVSHEMGTPLSRMRFQLELLENDAHLPQQRNRLRALSEDLDELDNLSSELVSWMETAAKARMDQEFEIGPLLESLVELECHAVSEGIAVDLIAPPGITLRADPRQFQRAIENLLRNAQRYAQQHIVVDVKVADGAVIVEVRDDGPGIPPDEWDRVLEPFVRLEEPRTRAHRGLGLGLAIVRRTLDAHGGSVRVTSAPEGGTRVETRWPESRPAAEQTHSRTASVVQLCR